MKTYDGATALRNWIDTYSKPDFKPFCVLLDEEDFLMAGPALSPKFPLPGSFESIAAVPPSGFPSCGSVVASSEDLDPAVGGQYRSALATELHHALDQAFKGRSFPSHSLIIATANDPSKLDPTLQDRVFKK